MIGYVICCFNKLRRSQLTHLNASTQDFAERGGESEY